MLSFDVEGTTCRGTLFVPSTADNPPAVVLAPGIGAEQSSGYLTVAERLAAAGFAAFVFDYRGFGAADGDTRVIDPARQRADYAGALDRLTRVSAIGDGRVLWGLSLSAGHALTLAADRPTVDAVIAISPVLDWRSVIRARGARYALRASAAAGRDAVGSRFGRGVTVPIVSEPGTLGVLTEPGLRRGFLACLDRTAPWRNETPARTVAHLARYRPVTRCDAVDVPTLFVTGEADPLNAPETIAAASEAVASATVVSTPAGHFGPLTETLTAAVGHQCAFLSGVFDY